MIVTIENFFLAHTLEISKRKTLLWLLALWQRYYFVKKILFFLDFDYIQVDDLIQVPINKEETKGYVKQIWDSIRGKNPDSEMRRQFRKTLPVLFKHYIEYGMEQTPNNRILYFAGLLRGFFTSRSRVSHRELPWNKLHENKHNCTKVLEDFITLIV